jgi:predicted amidophosphoribosyltransferase
MRYRSAVASSVPVLLLDDVVTTGATLLEARRAIEAAGIPVVGFATFAETPSLRDAKEQKKAYVSHTKQSC